MKTPGIYTGPIKNFLNYRKNPLGFLKNIHDEFGSLAYINFMNKDVFLVSDPEDIEHILLKNSKNYLKGRTTKKLSSILGKGLITSEGEYWKKRNRLIRSSFTNKKVSQSSTLILKVVEEWIRQLEENKRYNLVEEMHKVSAEIIFKLLLQKKPNESLFNDVKTLLDYILYKTRSLFPLPLFVPTSRNRNFKQALKNIDDLIYNSIDKRLEKLQNKEKIPKDFLSLLLNNETLSDFSRIQARDEVITLIMAGHETVANTLAWTWVSINERKDLKDQLKELSSVVFEKNTLKEEILWDNNIAKKIIMESMRMHPPVWVFMRESISEDILRSKYKIPAGSTLVLAPYFTHRDKTYWKDSLEFNPERFQKLNPNSDVQGIRYFPFGYGPRVCIGQSLALVESQIVLLKMIKNLELIFEGKKKQEFNEGITLSPATNTFFRIKKI